MACGIFAGGGAGALQANLAADDFLQRELDLGRDVADQSDGAALANASRCSRRSFRCFRRLRGLRRLRAPLVSLRTCADEIGFGGLRSPVAPSSLAILRRESSMSADEDARRSRWRGALGG